MAQINLKKTTTFENPETGYVAIGVNSNGEFVSIDETGTVNINNYTETVTIEGSTGAYASYTGIAIGTSTSVTITANVIGSAGNIILAYGHGIGTGPSYNDLISAWNIANPSNTITLTSGDGSQTPDLSALIELTGGVDVGGSPNDIIINHNLNAKMVVVYVYNNDGQYNNFWFINNNFRGKLCDFDREMIIQFADVLPNSVKINYINEFTVGLDYTFVVQKLC